MFLSPHLSYPPRHWTVSVMPDLLVSDLSFLYFSHLSIHACMYVVWVGPALSTGRSSPYKYRLAATFTRAKMRKRAQSAVLQSLGSQRESDLGSFVIQRHYCHDVFRSSDLPLRGPNEDTNAKRFSSLLDADVISAASLANEIMVYMVYQVFWTNKSNRHLSKV